MRGKSFAASASLAVLMISGAAAAGPNKADQDDLTAGRYFVTVMATSICGLQPSTALGAELSRHPMVKSLGDAYDNTGKTPVLDNLPCDQLSKLQVARAPSGSGK